MARLQMDEETESFEDVTCRAETDKACLCVIKGEEVWIPKSQIDDASEVFEKGGEGTLVVTTWIAEQKGLV